MATRVGIVILGDEVLKGEIREANLAHMIPLLAEWGAETALCAILPDDVSVVVRHLRRFREEVDFLVLTGGIGPTPDDITRDAVAEVAGVPLIVHPEAKAALEAHPYKGANPEYRMLMAQVPQGATLIPNPLSPAPGFFIDRMAVFPGVPCMLQAMFEWVKPMVSGRRKSRVTLYANAPESSYAGIMKEAMTAFPDVGIGSYPMSDGKYRVRVVFRGDRFERTDACAAAFASPDRHRVDPVLLLEDPGGERLLRVVLVHRYDRLHDDRPGVDPLVEEVDGAPREPDAVPQRLRRPVGPGEGGEQRRVDVEDPVRERAKEDRRHHPHEAGQADEDGPRGPDHLHQLRVERLPAFVRLVVHHRGRDPVLPRPREAVGVRLVAQRPGRPAPGSPPAPRRR